MTVAIGLIFSHGFPVPTCFLKGLFDWYAHVLSGEGNRLLTPGRAITQARIIYSEDFPIDAARNDIVRQWLDASTADYLVFLDADMRHPKDVIHRLVRHDLPIVTGRYQMRRPPFHTVAMRKAGPGPHEYRSISETSGLVPIDAGGAGVLAIRRDAAVAMRAAMGDVWFKYQTGPDGLTTVSEDMWFYEQAAALGIQAMCDLDCKCTHEARFEIDETWHAPFRKAYDAKANEAAA